MIYITSEVLKIPRINVFHTFVGVFMVVCGTLMSLVHLSLYIIVYNDKISYLPRGRSQLFYYSPIVWYCLRKYRQQGMNDSNDYQDVVVRKFNFFRKYYFKTKKKRFSENKSDVSIKLQSKI